MGTFNLERLELRRRLDLGDLKYGDPNEYVANLSDDEVKVVLVALSNTESDAPYFHTVLERYRANKKATIDQTETRFVSDHAGLVAAAEMVVAQNLQLANQD